jgi:hypothetical protein
MSGSRPLTMTWSDVADTNIASTSSFQYEAHSTPLKSTQQLNVDWSQFQNHTFFMSAEAKVNLAFDAIINGYPFDGTRQEVEVFFEKLSGFDRWIFDNFPKYKGALEFTGADFILTTTLIDDITTESSQELLTEDIAGTGPFIAVQNKVGALFPELSRGQSGQPVLNPKGSTSLTIEMQLFLPAGINKSQTICQMLANSTQGFSFYLTSSIDPSSTTGYFAVVSGSSFMTVPVQLQKGRYNHVAVTLNKNEGLPFLESFIDAKPAATSATQVEMGDLAIDEVNFLIGIGTPLTLGTETITTAETLVGTLDEFRVFHSTRTPQQQAAFAAKSLYATDDLVLYYRFNEPAPPIVASLSDSINAIVLDSSGNSLHSIIQNFDQSLRIDVSNDSYSPMLFERPDSTPVLFPAYPSLTSFNQQLLASASLYDQQNPNLITRLIPQHYLLEGAAHDGFEEPEGTAGQAYKGNGIPGQGQMGNVQVLLSMLYIWARFFDDIKLFVDSFSTLKTVDYDTNDTIPDNFLLDLVKAYGFHLPPLFNDSTIEQYVRGENVDLQNITVNESSLRTVQNTLLRRVLVNLPDVLRSKGTQHSIRSFLRAVGIDPGNNVRIREFGGPTTQQLSFSRETKHEPGAMVDFSTGSLAVSPFLSASRVEPGFPYPVGNFVQQKKLPPNGISDNASDGLLTSGSWTWEGVVKFTPTATKTMQSATQSLARICVATGTVPTNTTPSTLAHENLGIIANLIAISSSIDPKLVLYLRSGDTTSTATSPLLRIELATPNPGIFNFDRWNVSFGCQRGDDGLNSPVSSSYFLRLGYQNDGRIEFLETTSSFFQETTSGNNVLRKLHASHNLSGSFLAVGTKQIVDAGTGATWLYLNDNSIAPAEARVTNFTGRISNMRFWSKALSEDEWMEHVRNYNSVGVKNPLVNWNYEHVRTGSFEHLRLNTFTRQDIRRANSTSSVGPVGYLGFIDFSENGFHMTGSGFPVDQDVVVGEIFDMSYLSPYFDEASNSEKIRIRSYQDFDLVEQTPWAGVAPVYEIVASEQPTDDVRFIIEFSLIDALNRDIIALFATLDALDNALGSPELVFSPDYPDLDRMRSVYFRRVKEKLNFQAFFEFFRWFDASVGTFIQQLIPRKTRFKGTNFTIESHMLERAKQEYLFSEMYLGDSNRQRLNSAILLQQVAGNMRKY